MDKGNATAVVNSLSSAEIRQRIAELTGERDALRVLLRAALAREAATRKRQGGRDA